MSIARKMGPDYPGTTFIETRYNEEWEIEPLRKTHSNFRTEQLFPSPPVSYRFIVIERFGKLFPEHVCHRSLLSGTDLTIYTRVNYIQAIIIIIIIIKTIQEKKSRFSSVQFSLIRLDSTYHAIRERAPQPGRLRAGLTLILVLTLVAALLALPLLLHLFQLLGCGFHQIRLEVFGELIYSPRLDKLVALEVFANRVSRGRDLMASQRAPE